MGGADPGDHLKPDTGVIKRGRLFIKTGKDHGVPPFQPHDPLARCRAASDRIDHQPIHISLCGGWAIGGLTDINEFSLAAAKLQNLRADKPVMKDDIRLMQQIARPHHQQRWISGTRPDNHHLWKRRLITM